MKETFKQWLESIGAHDIQYVTDVRYNDSITFIHEGNKIVIQAGWCNNSTAMLDAFVEAKEAT